MGSVLPPALSEVHRRDRLYRTLLSALDGQNAADGLTALAMAVATLINVRVERNSRPGALRGFDQSVRAFARQLLARQTVASPTIDGERR